MTLKKKVLKTINSRSEKANIINYISDNFYRYTKNIFYNFKEDILQKIEPNLVIIGAQKSGTSSLHKYLDQHPSIFMAKPIKEPGYYLDFELAQKFLAKRNINFKNKEILLTKFMLRNYKGEKYVGESSTYYTIGNIGIDNNVAENIFSTNPETKLIYILRNPIARMISNYTHGLERGYHSYSINQFFSKDEKPLLTSLYYHQLSPFLKYFDANQIKVVLFEELISNPDSCLQEITDFLEIAPFQQKIEAKVHNQSNIKETLESDTLKISDKNKDIIYGKIIEDTKLLSKFTGKSLIQYWGLDLDL